MPTKRYDGDVANYIEEQKRLGSSYQETGDRAERDMEYYGRTARSKLREGQPELGDRYQRGMQVAAEVGMAARRKRRGSDKRR